MSQEETTLETRQVEAQIEITAPAETVWKALTDADELTRWFPLQARVTPGPGGSIWISWGPPYEGEVKIEIWEPNRRLRLIETRPPFTDAVLEQAGADGVAGAEAKPQAPATLIAMDYHLESHGGKTVLRLVHSGFGIGAEWDDEVESVRRGWKFELRGLRHYLERHRGTPRQMVWLLARTEIPVEAVWARLMGADGFLSEGTMDNRREGDRYSIRAATGDRFEGFVQLYDPPNDFSVTLENLSDSLLRVGVNRMFGKTEFFVSCSTYGWSESQFQAMSDRLAGLVDTLFPSARQLGGPNG